MLKFKKIPAKTVIVGAIALALLGASVFAAVQIRDEDTESGPIEITTADGQKLIVEPTTDNEKKETEDYKQQLAQNNGQSGASTANVIITEASGGVVRAYVSGVYEDGGICTATAVQGSQVVTRSSTGFKNVSYTQCPPIEWNLSSGTWTIKVTYKSTTAEGQSAPQEVSVQQ